MRDVKHAASPTSRVLIVEDDADLAALISHYLARSGFTGQTVSDGGDALTEARKPPVPDLIILDLMLPRLGGLDVCKALRADDRTAAVPIIMLTARGEESERITGLDAGADDYVVKPFSPSELMARVRAVRRRTTPSVPKDRVLRCGPISVDVERHTVSNGQEPVRLTAKEFLLLQYLLEHPGRVLSRDRLLNDVWDYRYGGETRTVDVHVRRLREKLPFLERALVTVQQFGYKLEEP